MNNTQRGAVFTLGCSLLLIALAIHGTFIVFDIANGNAGNAVLKVRIWAAIITIYMAVTMYLLYRSKRKTREPEADERDILIQFRAAIATFAATWILFAIAFIALWTTLSLGGSLLVCFFPLICLAVFIASLFVHSVAVLIQYRWRK